MRADRRILKPFMKDAEKEEWIANIDAIRLFFKHIVSGDTEEELDEDIAVVRKMFEFRFPGISCEDLTLAQIRGMEGVRIRETYKFMSKKTGVKWTGRKYKVDNYQDKAVVNRGLTSGMNWEYIRRKLFPCV
ncbi:CRISPR-associated endonuclease Cas1 [Anaerotignum neopropionicum]|nr:hypothetical protein [Anaerotignum neopropionicum]